ncbi:uncharacterized protein LOC119769593 [Culex quinquefasciatus]|uniref:uncharacterized protein LOC119769593 n=1 Tax=Culex quinquefasciatus TaxID=7176 RepID=UPI0018E389B9|nr:uncharacterized protein LOC119769593 [Culex quinquefasciatus]
MPRIHKKDPTKRKSRVINDEQLKRAMDAVAAGMTVRMAQTKFGISRSALHRYLKQARLNPDEPVQVGRKGGPIWLPENLEKELVSTVMLFSSQDNALTSLDLRCLVKSYLDRENLVISKFKDNMPGYDWSQSFVTRHGLTDFMAGRTKRRKEDSSRKGEDPMLADPLECFVKVEMDEPEDDPS